MEVIEEKDEGLVEMTNGKWRSSKIHSNWDTIQQKRQETINLLNENFTDIFEKVDGLKNVRYTLTDDRMEYRKPEVRANCSLVGNDTDKMAEFMQEKKEEVRNLAREMEDKLDLSFPLYTNIIFEHPHDV